MENDLHSTKFYAFVLGFLIKLRGTLYFYGNFNGRHPGNNFYFYENYFLKRFTPLGLAAGTGLLLWAAWPASPLTLLIFLAWIPLLWLEEIVVSRKKFFGYTYLAMFTWNVATTWWIWNASPPGAIAAFLANSFLMCLPWLGFKIAKKWMSQRAFFGGETGSYISLIAFWMCFEYIHLQDWGLSWPWLSLGNVFAARPDWVQWYSITGASGGTLWVLVMNILLYRHLRNNLARTDAKTYRNLIAAAALLIIPVAISFFSKGSQSLPGAAQNIVVVQPNIDPYEKVSTGSFEAQLQKLIHTSEKEVDSKTALIVWPETALYMGNGIDEATLKENFFLNPLWGFLQRHPQASLFTGIESYRQFDSATKYSHRFQDQYFESYNGSVLLDTAGAHGFYHKSMLVPGVETLPWFLKFLGRWFDKFGGTTAGYAKQKERTVLPEKNGFKIAPSICYESIYGEFMSRYIRKGANIIVIITNDGWWKKTPGHKQHMHYARLRAIETRTWVARSANTGISCFIDPYGKVINAKPYNTSAAIKLAIEPGQPKTFFVRYGDLLSKIAVLLSIVLLAVVVRRKITSRLKANNK